MKIVLDTNTLISGVFFGGPPFQILRAWHDDKVELVVSKAIFEEYQRVGDRLAKHFPDVDFSPFLDLIAIGAEMVAPARLPAQICSDPDDDKFLACAVAGRCGIIVTGDRQLLKVSGYRGIQILRPRKFVEEYLRE